MGAAFAAATAATPQERTQQHEQVKARVQERAGQREIIPGSELMTAAEREAYIEDLVAYLNATFYRMQR